MSPQRKIFTLAMFISLFLCADFIPVFQWNMSFTVMLKIDKVYAQNKTDLTHPPQPYHYKLELTNSTLILKPKPKERHPFPRVKSSKSKGKCWHFLCVCVTSHKKPFAPVVVSITIRAYQKKMAIRSRGKSRQIAEKFGKFRFFKNGDHFFKKSRRIASQRAIQKTMAIILEVKL